MCYFFFFKKSKKQKGKHIFATQSPKPIIGNGESNDNFILFTTSTIVVCAATPIIPQPS